MNEEAAACYCGKCNSARGYHYGHPKTWYTVATTTAVPCASHDCWTETSEEDETGAELPFYPDHTSHVSCEENLRVSWFEPAFSQCRYNFDNVNCGSNACTLIVLLVASKCFTEKIQLYGPTKSANYFLIKALAEAILEGNEIHNTLKHNGALPHINLTVPEAILFAGNSIKGIKEWKSVLYTECLSTTLYENLKKHWNEWQTTSYYKQHPELYIVLICSARSVLFIIQPNKNTVTLIDSHQHTCSKGALIAVANRHKTKYLCNFFAEIMTNYYNCNSNLYELSFLFFRKRYCKCKKY